MAGEREESVLFATRYAALDDLPEDPKADAKWGEVISVRNEVSKQIEKLRVDGKVGSALDANVRIFTQGAMFDTLMTLGDELRFVLITSEASVQDLNQAPSEAVETEIDGLKLMVSAMSDEKCVRCWHRRPDIGSVAEHPELCGRCVSNITGEGELRDYA